MVRIAISYSEIYTKVHVHRFVSSVVKLILIAVITYVVLKETIVNLHVNIKHRVQNPRRVTKPVNRLVRTRRCVPRVL